jgi:prevent-host-death family protein
MGIMYNLDSLDLFKEQHMSSVWPLQDAKNRFSEVVNRSMSEGPQEIARHGKKTAVVLSMEEYRRLKRGSQKSLVDFFQKSPLSQIEIERHKDYPRRVTL